MTNLARKWTQLHPILWRLCTGECISLSLIFQKECLSWLAFTVTFRLLQSFIAIIVAEMSHSVSRKYLNGPKYRVADYHTIAQKHHCNPLCLSILMKHTLATIWTPSILLKNSVMVLSPPAFSVVISLPQFSPDWWGGHYILVSECVVFHWLVSIPTTP